MVACSRRNGQRQQRRPMLPPIHRPAVGKLFFAANSGGGRGRRANGAALHGDLHRRHHHRFHPKPERLDPPQNFPGETVVGLDAYRDIGGGGQDTVTRAYIYGYSFGLNNTKTVQASNCPRTKKCPGLRHDPGERFFALFGSPAIHRIDSGRENHLLSDHGAAGQPMVSAAASVCPLQRPACGVTAPSARRPPPPAASSRSLPARRRNQPTPI